MNDDPLQLTVEANGTFTRNGTDDDDDSDFSATVTHTDVAVTVECPLNDDVYDDGLTFSRNGSYSARVYNDNLADVLSDRLREGYTLDSESMEITIHGTVDEWMTFAISRADETITVGTDAEKVELAIGILLDLAQYNDGLTPYLGAIQYADQYDTKYDFETIFDALSEDGSLSTDEMVNVALDYRNDNRTVAGD